MTTTTRQTSLFPTIRLKSWAGVLLGIVALLVLGIVAFVIFQPIQVLPRIRLAPGFSLVDQNGQRLSNEDLRGQFVLYNFTLSDCDAPTCAQNEQIMRQVQQRLGEAETFGTPVTLVSIAVDGDQATPDALRAHAQTFGPEPEQWRFVSGDPVRLKSIVGSGFEVYYEQKADGAYTLSPTMILVDGWGIIRAVYHIRTTPPDADTILRHFGVLAEEVQNSKGAARLGYEAAHLFLCYAS